MKHPWFWVAVAWSVGWWHNEISRSAMFRAPVKHRPLIERLNP